MKINKKGFTLIELLVVIAIIGLLSTLAVVSLNSARAKARDARRQSDLKQISTAMELYMSEREVYPAAAGVGNCAATFIAETSGGDICPPGTPIEDGTGNTFLQSLPSDPQWDSATAGSNYEWTGSDSTYCLEAELETADTTYFICVDGSCYGSNSACP